MPQSLRFVVFNLDDARYALPLEAVERVVRAVAVTALPKAPAIVLGVINVQGEIIPVINLRRLNSLPERAVQHEDEFIIAREDLSETPRHMALWVDAVQGVVECEPHEILPAAQLFSGVENITGAIRGREGIILIQDLAQLLTSQDVVVFDEALKQNELEASGILTE